MNSPVVRAFPQATDPSLRESRKVFRLHIFEVHKAAGLEKGRHGFQNSGDLLDGELRALFF